MKVLLEHQGDGKNDGWQTREWSVEREEKLEQPPIPVDRPLSEANGVMQVTRNESLSTVTLRLHGGEEINVPNVTVVEVVESID